MLGPCGTMGPTRGTIDPRRRSPASATDAVARTERTSATNARIITCLTPTSRRLFISGPEARPNGFPHELRPARVPEVGRVVPVPRHELGALRNLPAAGRVEVHHAGAVPRSHLRQRLVELGRQ